MLYQLSYRPSISDVEKQNANVSYHAPAMQEEKRAKKLVEPLHGREYNPPP